MGVAGETRLVLIRIEPLLLLVWCPDRWKASQVCTAAEHNESTKPQTERCGDVVLRSTPRCQKPLMIPSSCRARQAKLRKRVSDGSGTMPSLITCLRSVRLAIPRKECVSQRFTGWYGGLCWSYDAGRAAPCPAQHVTSVKVARLKNHENWNGHTVTMTMTMTMTTLP